MRKHHRSQPVHASQNYQKRDWLLEKIIGCHSEEPVNDEIVKTSWGIKITASEAFPYSLIIVFLSVFFGLSFCFSFQIKSALSVLSLLRTVYLSSSLSPPYPSSKWNHKSLLFFFLAPHPSLALLLNTVLFSIPAALLPPDRTHTHVTWWEEKGNLINLCEGWAHHRCRPINYGFQKGRATQLDGCRLRIN